MKSYLFFFIFFILGPALVFGQNDVATFNVKLLNEQQTAFENVIVTLYNAETKALVKTAVSDKDGFAVFNSPFPGNYYLTAKSVGYADATTEVIRFPHSGNLTIHLAKSEKSITEVAIVGRKPFIQRVQGKTVVNVEASVTNAGTTVLEVLEKSPGVMVDKNGGVSLMGKSSVLVMIDDKPTYLSGAELSNLLGSMNSSQVNQIELITNPSAKYDASGNAGIINIKTKKNVQQGLNGTFTTSYGQGRYYKSNNALNLNYRQGKFNSFLNYSVNFNKGFTDIYALRKYLDEAGDLKQILDQPTYLTSESSNQLLKAGTDFYASDKVTLGISLTGNLIDRDGSGEAKATWLSPSEVIDSAIATYTSSALKLKNGAANLNLRYKIDAAQELTFDFDGLKYDIANDQYFTNKLLAAGGYIQGSIGDIPSTIKIFSAKTDHSLQIGKNKRLESGFKSSAISTDNIADYILFDGVKWKEDLDKSNHFLYKEYINSIYSSFDFKGKKISAQAGLRYENTRYNGRQFGNSAHPDSSFSKHYSNLFPSGNLSYQLDSANSLSFTTGRRIDRPAYQKLNPFVFIINKYTHQQGNPYFLPQYSWNFEVAHSWKNQLITTVSYSTTKNYFSQLFLSKGDDILVYTDGNVGSMQNIGVSLAVQFQLFNWWSLTGQSVFNHKQLSGYQNVRYASSVNQLHTSLNNQFRINKTLTAELSGFYTTQARNDLQELLTPTGQLSAGFAQTLFKGKGTLRLSGRDILYTNAMEGMTDFPGANEYFILWRDSQVINLGFSLRFGKPLKATKRSNGGAADEINRAGS